MCFSAYHLQNDDGVVMVCCNFEKYDLSSNGSTVVTFTFSQPVYMFLENVGTGSVCVDKTGNTDQEITITVIGGMLIIIMMYIYHNLYFY